MTPGSAPGGSGRLAGGLLCTSAFLAVGALVWDLVDAGRLPRDSRAGWLGLEAIGAAVLVVTAARAHRRVGRGQSDPGAISVIQLFFTFLVASWVLVIAFAPAEFSPGAVGALLIAGLAAFALVVDASPALERRWPHRVLSLVRLVALELAVVVVLLEAGLRLTALVRPAPLLLMRDAGPMHQLLTFRLEPGTVWAGFPVNSGGHNDDEFVERRPGRPLVALIGDSFSLGVVPRTHHYSRRVEELLPGVEVANLGVNGAGPPQYRYLLEREALPLRPDLVVLALFVGNDVGPEASVWQPHRALRLVFDRQNALVWNVPRRAIAGLAVRRAEIGGLPSTGGPVLRDAMHAEEMMPWLRSPALEPPTFTPEAFLEIETRRARFACGANERFVSRLLDQLAAMRADCGATPLAVMLIPDELQVEESLWREVTGLLPAPALERDRAQRAIVAWCTAQDLPVLDLLPVLRAVEPFADGRRHLYHLRNTHFNARGNALTAAELARFIATRTRRVLSREAPAALDRLDER